MGATIDEIIKAAKIYLPSLDGKRVKEAYAFAKKAHEGQVRFSGDPYITHPLEAAKNLLPLKPDEDTLLACLLHDVPSDTNTSLASVEKAFGRSVAELVHNVEKMSLVRVKHGQAEVESWRKMFIAMAKDLRAVFIRLADRLHNMETLEYVAREKQKRIAEETLYVYAAIASRLGIYSIKGQLEDLCFKYIHPEDYERLHNELETYGRVNVEHMEKAKDVLDEFLKEEGIEGEVSGRIKHLYSIYRKLQRKNADSLDSIYDLFAMRIVLSDQHREGREFLGHCYTMLGAIHNEWTPVPGRFKDYIAVPKLNGYRSLHTTIIGKRVFINQPVEIQIRTQGMNQEAEYGIASHWWYEDNDPSEMELSRHEIQNVLGERRLVSRFYDFLEAHPDKRALLEQFLSLEADPLSDVKLGEIQKLLRDAGFSTKEIDELRYFMGAPKAGGAKPFQHHVDWLYGLERLQDDLQKDSVGENEGTSLDIFSHRIFVLTPHGDVKDLPLGSTPVDFAYAIHSDVGNSCYQARVNGSIVKLDHELSSGDVVEIVTRKNAKPSRYWLSFVKTDMAKTRIKSWFRTVDREKNIKAGVVLLNKELRRLGKPPLGSSYRALKMYGDKKHSFAEREHIVESVGNGMLTMSAVVRNLFSDEELMGELQEKEVVHTPTVEEKKVREDESGVLITGEDKLPVILSGCCKPKFPDDIVGYVTRGKAIRVHKAACRQLQSVEKERLLSASWAAQKSPSHYQIKIYVEAEDRVGMLNCIIAVVAGLDLYLVDCPLVSKSEGRVTRHVIVEMPNYDLLAKLLSQLEKIEGVTSVKKL